MSNMAFIAAGLLLYMVLSLCGAIILGKFIKQGMGDE